MIRPSPTELASPAAVRSFVLSSTLISAYPLDSQLVRTASIAGKPSGDLLILCGTHASAHKNCRP